MVNNIFHETLIVDFSPEIDIGFLVIPIESQYPCGQ